jgi:dTDP-4-dehydrorhamnose 3,5-epimerase-like enzyme
MVYPSILDVKTIDLPCYSRADGEIVVAEAGAHVPFKIARMFTLHGPSGVERGKHAHKLCSQLMLCVHGETEIVCDDGSGRKSFALDRSNRALLVPPTIWNTVIFRKQDPVLVVLCDRPYVEDDYIREYPEFMAFRKAVG